MRNTPQSIQDSQRKSMHARSFKETMNIFTFMACRVASPLPTIDVVFAESSGLRPLGIKSAAAQPFIHPNTL